MSRGTFQVDGDSLVGHGLTFDIASLVTSDPKIDPADKGRRLVEIVEVAYREGRSSAILSWDDRFDLHCTVDALRALAVIVGPSATGDRHRRAADIIARLLQDQEVGS